jgi:hypothetical protein
MRGMELLFVYNANGGLINGLFDFAHKNLSPKTYSCNLCAITYGNLGMKKEWKNYLKNIPYSIRFFHKDEFAQKYPDSCLEPLPTLFVKEKDAPLRVLVSADEINAARNIADLQKILDQKLIHDK